MLPLDRGTVLPGLRDHPRLAAGRLLLASDHQGCCDWVVDLAPALPADWNVPLPGMESLPQDQAAVAARADPPVRLSVPGEPDEIWSLAAPQFSAYVHGEAMGHRLPRSRTKTPSLLSTVSCLTIATWRCCTAILWQVRAATAGRAALALRIWSSTGSSGPASACG